MESMQQTVSICGSIAFFRIKTSPVAQGFKISQPDGKQLAAFFFFLRLAGFADF
jgi:hypothetical protein